MKYEMHINRYKILLQIFSVSMQWWEIENIQAFRPWLGGVKKQHLASPNI